MGEWMIRGRGGGEWGSRGRAKRGWGVGKKAGCCSNKDVELCN